VVLAAVNGPFLVFVMGLAVVVRAAVENGLGDAADSLVPGSESLLALLTMAAIGAVLANIVNNLPALLILLPATGAVGSLAVLAVLIGVNIGPNLTYPGSLATLLWRRVLDDHGLVPSLRRFTVLGLLTAPACIIVGVGALCAAGRVLGS
jgi:arsenical pump membrane protein